MDEIKKMRLFIESISGKIPDVDWNLYAQNLIHSCAKKGTVLLDYNKPCTKIWHLVSGAVRKTELNNGTSTTSHFYTAPKVITVLQSALNQTPSEHSIICEEDCSILEMPFKKIQKLFDQSHYIERIGRRIVENEFIDEFALRRMFLKMDALKRYEYMEINHSDILNRFQLKDVATFLGVTPESLSRLRKNRFAK